MILWMLLLGCFILIFSMYDVLWTTLSASEQGHIGIWIMRLYKKISHLFPSKFYGFYKVLRAIGIFTFLSVILFWYFLFWTGWSLIFISVQSSVVSSSDGREADSIEKVYFIGYAIFSAGLGDFKPIGHTYQMLTTLANATGMILITLTISYLVSALEAVHAQRRLAGNISILGKNPYEILENSWNGSDFSSLSLSLNNLSGDIVNSTLQLFRYPLIFNFHSVETEYSAPIKIATLSEVLIISECFFHPNVQLSRKVVLQCKHSITKYMEAMKISGLDYQSDLEVPYIPSFSIIEQMSSRLKIPIVSRRAAMEKLSSERIKQYRRIMLILVKDSRRSFDEVYSI